MNPESNDPESSQSLKIPKRLTRKGIFAVIAGIMLIGGIAAMFVIQNNKNDKTVSKPKAVNRGEPNPPSGKTIDAPLLEPTKPEGEFAKMVYDADKLIAVSDSQAAIKKLKDYAPKVKGPDQELAVDSRLATLYFGLKDWQQALDWGERAQKTNQPGASGLNLTIAISAENLGNKPKAIAAYRAVLDGIKNEKGSFFDNQRQQYQDKIKALGG